MKKTAGVTKYEIHWQVLRNSLKGNMNDDLQGKILKAYTYYKEKPCFDRYERVANWIEGLYKGFKSLEKREEILFTLQTLDFSNKERSYSEINSASDFQSYSESQLESLWKDLLKTNLQWLSKGYYHKELNNFMLLLSTCICVDLTSLNQAKEKVSYLKNTHKFFF